MIFSKGFVLLCASLSLYAQNINYTTSDIQTLTMKKNSSTVSLEYILMNDTVDLLKLKESETTSNSALSAMGDLKGYGAKFRYGLTDNLMINMNIEKFSIDVYDSEIVNKRKDIFLRYNLFNNPYTKLNSGVSIDLGYVTNQLEDVSIRGFSQIDAQKNAALSQIDDAIDIADENLVKITSIKTSLVSNGLDSSETFITTSFDYSDGINTIRGEPFVRPEGYYVYTALGASSSISDTQYDDAMDFINKVGYINVDEIEDDLTATKLLLEESKQDLIDASLKLQNNKDKSKYIRLVTGYYDKNSAFNAYIGVKNTKIYSSITLDTIDNLKKKYEELNSIANKYQLGMDTQTNDLDDIEKHLNREEKMLFAGINYTLESKDYIYEFGLEYDKFKREEGLDYIDYNVIIDGTLSYKYNDRTLLFAGARLMYRQLNGQIPYLYNEYTQTSYDHKYGYTKFGVQYRF